MATAPARDPDQVFGPESQDPLRTALAAGATIVKIENESMMSLAVQRPRDPAKVLQEALQELELVPSLAARNWYSIPFKNHVRGCPRRNCNCPSKPVEGPSINAARNLMRQWGNASAKALVTSEDDEKLTLAGVFIDLQTNVRFERPFTVSKWQHRRNGPAVKVGQERLVQAIQAGASKAERNAIIAGLPDWLVKSYTDKARQIARKDAKENKFDVIDVFMTVGVNRDLLERYLGKSVDKIDDDERVHLIGMYNALRDREQTIEEMFGTDEPAENGNGGETEKPRTVEDIIQGGAKVTGGTQAESKPAEPPAEPKPEPEEPEPTKPDRDPLDFEGDNCPGCERHKDLIPDQGHHRDCMEFEK